MKEWLVQNYQTGIILAIENSSKKLDSSEKQNGRYGQ